MFVPVWQQQLRISNCHTNFTKQLIFLGERREEKAKERRQGRGTRDLVRKQFINKWSKMKPC